MLLVGACCQEEAPGSSDFEQPAPVLQAHNILARSVPRNQPAIPRKQNAQPWGWAFGV